jgi:hypothetical protein
VYAFIMTTAFIGSTQELVSVSGRSCCRSDEGGHCLGLVATKSSCGELSQSVMGPGGVAPARVRKAGQLRGERKEGRGGGRKKRSQEGSKGE